jgi:hypothetical protein
MQCLASGNRKASVAVCVYHCCFGLRIVAWTGLSFFVVALRVELKTALRWMRFRRHEHCRPETVEAIKARKEETNPLARLVVAI